MIITVQVILRLPRRGSSWLFRMSIRILETSLGIALSLPLPPFFIALLKAIPVDPRSPTNMFGLDAKTTVYAVCTKCHSTWKPSIVNGIPSYPDICRFKRYGATCKEQLTRPRRIKDTTFHVPIKQFVSYDFKDWMAALLSRPGFEEKMDAAWERGKLSRDGKISDIFQGEVLQNFMGPDKKTHFSVSGEAGHYVFALSEDGMNPLGNKLAGKSITVGVISLVCLSLPPEERYKPENMFLAGIVPGPKDPKLDRINPYLTPLVDAFLEFWNTGVHFTRTCLYKLGRLVRCAIVALVCDLPAARKVGGFSSYKHNFFCSICKCTKHPVDPWDPAEEESESKGRKKDKKKDKAQRKKETEEGRRNMVSGLNNCDFETWERRTNDSCRAASERWKNAKSAKQADSFFDRSGHRWSELLRLPYFDPSRFVVVDSMHNLFLGLIMEHFRGILGYELSESKAQKAKKGRHVFQVPIDMKTNPFEGTDKQKAKVLDIIKFLASPLSLDTDEGYASATATLARSTCYQPCILYVTEALGIDLEGKQRKKSVLIKCLLDWVSSQLLYSSSLTEFYSVYTAQGANRSAARRGCWTHTDSR